MTRRINAVECGLRQLDDRVATMEKSHGDSQQHSQKSFMSFFDFTSSTKLR